VLVRAIFDDIKFPQAFNTHDSIHVGKATAEVYGEDGTGPWRERLFDAPRVQAVRIRVNVHEDRDSVQEQDGADGPFPSVSRNHHFVAGLDPNGFERYLDGDSAVRDRKAESGAVEPRKLLGEAVANFVWKWESTPVPAG
jgi:hypothetical protein